MEVNLDFVKDEDSSIRRVYAPRLLSSIFMKLLECHW